MSLLVFGFFLAVVLNAGRLVGNLDRMMVLHVFLAQQPGDEARQNLETKFREHPAVAEIEFVSKQEALSTFREFQEDRGGSEMDLKEINQGENPLPPSFKVWVKERGDLQEVASMARGLAPVQEVRYPQKLAQRLTPAIRFLQVIFVLAMGILGAAAYSSVGNVIRLSVEARKREIRIMQLVGATDLYIKMPFLLEGVTFGLAGAAVALLLLLGIYTAGQGVISQVALFQNGLIPMQRIFKLLSLTLLGIGGVIGLVSSYRSVNSYLRREDRLIEEAEELRRLGY